MKHEGTRRFNGIGIPKKGHMVLPAVPADGSPFVAAGAEVKPGARLIDS